MILSGRVRVFSLIAVVGGLTALLLTGRTAGAPLSCPDKPRITEDTGGPPGRCELINGRSDLFASDLRHAIGGRLAAVWVSNDTIYNAGIVHPTYADAALVSERATAYGATGIVVPMKYPPAYLGRLFDGIEQILIKTDSFCSADVDEPTNKLRVVLSKADARVIAALRKFVPADILVIKIDPQGCQFGFL
jgi:hypothetical protein